MDVSAASAESLRWVTVDQCVGQQCVIIYLDWVIGRHLGEGMDCDTGLVGDGSSSGALSYSELGWYKARYWAWRLDL